ncbi:hypothetical protein DFH07DRAFT_1057938 [Mycena maculata]|uniref:Uncharacterized protein n=1 Tax=Mycena maculata TaxID=230809 RepID=A0AAD7JS97_9AGAR|nr:hypothetical protein DFH07DRAFT_1057938 [Mycena maculata]
MALFSIRTSFPATPFATSTRSKKFPGNKQTMPTLRNSNAMQIKPNHTHSSTGRCLETCQTQPESPSTSTAGFLYAALTWCTAWLFRRCLFLRKHRISESPPRTADSTTSRETEQDPAHTLKLQRLMERRGREAARAQHNRNVIVTFCGSAKRMFAGDSQERQMDELSEDEDDSKPVSTLPLDDELLWDSHLPSSPSPSTSSYTVARSEFSYTDKTVIFDQSRVAECWLRRERSWPAFLDIHPHSITSPDELDSPSRSCSPEIDDWDGTVAELEFSSDIDSRYSCLPKTTKGSLR